MRVLGEALEPRSDSSDLQDPVVSSAEVLLLGEGSKGEVVLGVQTARDGHVPPNRAQEEKLKPAKNRYKTQRKHITYRVPGKSMLPRMLPVPSTQTFG